MNQDIKQKWIKALRSGEYKQTTGNLCSLGEKGDSTPRFCCLGVLSELMPKIQKYDSPSGYRHYEGEPELLPEEVQDWSGVKSDDGVFDQPIPNPLDKDGVLYSLVECNDNGLDFKNIADIIEKEF